MICKKENQINNHKSSFLFYLINFQLKKYLLQFVCTKISSLKQTSFPLYIVCMIWYDVIMWEQNYHNAVWIFFFYAHFVYIYATTCYICQLQWHIFHTVGLTYLEYYYFLKNRKINIKIADIMMIDIIRLKRLNHFN